MSTSTRARTTSTPTRGSVPRVMAWITTVLSLVGLVASIYLSYEHATGSTSLACPETGVINCMKVTTSTYSTLLGIPVAYLGLAFFVAMVALMSPWAWASPRPELTYARWVAVGGGLLFVLYLVYAELYEVGSLCLWCTSVHVVTFLLFVVVVFAEALRE